MRSNKKDEKSSVSPRAAVAGGLLGGVGGRAALILGANHAGNLGDAYGESSLDSAKELFDKLKKDTKLQGLHGEVGRESAFYSPGGHGPQSKPWVGLPTRTDPFTVAHELGHASGGRVRQALMRGRGLLDHASRYGGLGLLAHAILTQDADEGMSATGYAAPAVAALSPLATLGEETAATLKARKILQKQKVPVKHLNKMMALQQANYLLHGASRVAPVAAGAAALHYYLKRKGKKDEA